MSSATQPITSALPQRQLEKQTTPPQGWRFGRKKRGLLSLIDDQTSMMLEAASLLESKEAEAARARIEAMYGEIHESERVLIQKLQKTLITPLDAEDLNLLSAQLRRLIHQQASVARSSEAIASAGIPNALPELATSSRQCAQSLAHAVHALPEDDSLLKHTSRAVADANVARKLIRGWQAELMAAKPVPVILRVSGFLQLPEELFRQYHRTARSLERILFKNT